MSDPTKDRMLYFNGVNGATGEYGVPPMTSEDLSRFIKGEATPDNLAELKHRFEQAGGSHYGVREGVDPKKLSEAGWGVVFAFEDHDGIDAIKDALAPLLSLRKQQAGDLYREYVGPDALRPEESKSAFLARHGMGPGPADPRKVPYYLLLVGGPTSIPFRFQSQLDVQYAVGRLHFDTVEAYASYAQSVVAAESETVALSRDFAFFGVANEKDRATQMSSTELVAPLIEHVRKQHPSWNVQPCLGEEATKAALAELLGGGKTPALIFTASHGMELPNGHARQTRHQGAIICQDWPGPSQWKGELPPDHYFAGDDLASDKNLLGLIGFHFACYGGGTPRLDEFAKQAFRDDRQEIAPFDFVADLPKRMLSHPKGGALAVMAHVERAWGYSFHWDGAGPQTAVFESTIDRLLDGHPVGSAFEYFDERYAELASDLSVVLEDMEFNKKVDPYRVAGLWTANNDARGYAILGDPAVRLPVAELTDDASSRPALEVVSPRGSVAARSDTPSAKDSNAAAVEFGLLDAPSEVSRAMQQASQKLATMLQTAIDNMSTLQVDTFVSDTMESVEYDSASKRFGDRATLRASTRIALDGDTAHLLPATKRDGDLEDERALEFHKEMVEAAQSHRTAMLQVVAETIARLLPIVK